MFESQNYTAHGYFLNLRRVIFTILAFATLLAVGSTSVAYRSAASELNRRDFVGFSSEDAHKLVLSNLLTQTSGPSSVTSEESRVISVVKDSSPAVVSVIASGEVPVLEECEEQPDSGEAPMGIRDFFGRPNLCERGTQVRRIGAASGFVVSADGHIITNKHVVADAEASYTVVLNDSGNEGRRVPAQVVARDPNNDVAVLKVDVSNLPHLKLGDSSSLQVGQTVIAIGYALGEFDNTVSKGVVSGLMRNISAMGATGQMEELRGLIQTDAAINMGNSGGPLLDTSGNVIGMNAAVAEAQNIGFAIPINAVRSAYEQVVRTGSIEEKERGFLGVRFTPVSPELATLEKLTHDYGMIVRGRTGAAEPAVIPGSPAAKAGIVENDIILEANGKKLNERNLLSNIVADLKPGEKITLKVSHEGRVRDVEITLGKNAQ